MVAFLISIINQMHDLVFEGSARFARWEEGGNVLNAGGASVVELFEIFWGERLQEAGDVVEDVERCGNRYDGQDDRGRGFFRSGKTFSLARSRFSALGEIGANRRPWFLVERG